MAGQQEQPKYRFRWPDSILAGLGPVGSLTPVSLNQSLCSLTVSTLDSPAGDRAKS